MENTWTTKTGQVMKISEMETSHINNCIKMLQSKMPDHEEDIVECADFPESMWYVPSCYTTLGAKHYHRKIGQFQDELIRRNEFKG